ncbi:hypothetical protein SAMN04487950_3686 [Halogranum rubrum]|uniref:Glycosyl transferases group 1 n=1 Tax=Halogranum rubrum TaxID=553466 RepID=A0A1I4HH60_9EURY|nr:hypothetical protein SAMN04487950_3686 [Halogranum rubrum]
MRVLIIPELYRPGDVSANATVNDAVTWVEQWLEYDETLHVYWLLPHRGDANYERDYVLADRERVTLIEADQFMGDTEFSYLFTGNGYTEDQLLALKRRIYDELGYVDIVVDQLREGRTVLYRWLLFLSGHRAGDPNPFAVIANVHDLMVPFKYPSDGHRIDYHRKLEVAEAAFSDGRWFKARLDADEMPVYGQQFLQQSVLAEALDTSVVTDSPIDFSAFDEAYASQPRWLHVAGSGWEKKHGELVMDIAATLYERLGIRTLLTSMDTIPAKYQALEWVEAHPEAPRDLYEEMLRKGDMAICATEYDTLARTWFEQAASGQVLVLRDEPWIYDCVPRDSKLVAPVDELEARAVWAAEHWEEAVAENRRVMAHVREVRSPERTGQKTYRDMVRLVDERRDEFESPKAKRIERIVETLDESTFGLDELNRASARYTENGKPLLDQEWCTITDLVFSLREMGYVDVGDGGTPTFATTVQHQRSPSEATGAQEQSLSPFNRRNQRRR